jgi:hypothetical protein
MQWAHVYARYGVFKNCVSFGTNESDPRITNSYGTLVTQQLKVENAPTKDDDAVTKKYVDDSKRSITWLALSERPAWTNYISLGGTTDTVTIGSNNF